MRAYYKVLIDACVLANYGLCDLLLRLAEKPRLYSPLWSEKILDEVREVQLHKLKRPWPEELVNKWRYEVEKHFPESIVRDFEQIEGSLKNDPDDRHVLAAAIIGQAPLILTFNLKDFPEEALKPWKIAVKHPQDYLITLYTMSADVVISKINEIAIQREKSPQQLLMHLSKAVPAFSKHVATTLEWEL